MKTLKKIYENNDWYCPYCEQLNNTEVVENQVECTWCEGVCKINKTINTLFLPSIKNRDRHKRRVYG